MPVPQLQRDAIEDIIKVLVSAKTKGKRTLCDMFMVLVDRDEWPEYYKACNRIIR
jgi:chromatin structure-remodeling complex subunit RSC1/2